MQSRIGNVQKLMENHSHGKTKYLEENFKARVLNEDPYIVKINNLLNDEEIEEILALTKGKFEKSNIVIDGELVYDDRQRNSSTAYIFKDGLPDNYSPVIENMIKKICYLSNCTRDKIEMMAVRYKKGEYFGEHVDYFSDDEINVLDKGGQRSETYFIYLNTLRKGEGGETEFTKLGIKSIPKKGDAVFWYNKDPLTGEMLPDTEHQGNPVTADTIKYGLNLFIREKSF